MTHKLDNGKPRFRNFVDKVASSTPRLPLVHSTDSFTLEDVLTDGELTPQSCPVFEGETLTYLFYGRPAFRPNADAEPTGLGHYLPICLIFKSDAVTDVKRVFPFDSGGFQSGIYGAFLHKKMRLGDFGLTADLSTPGRIITHFFGTVDGYLRGKAVAAADYDPAEFEAQSYHALISAKGANIGDDRGAAIEVQTTDNLSVATAVEAVVLPSTFVDGETGRKLNALGIETLPYHVIDRMRPGEYISQIPSLCRDYYVRTGLIPKGGP